MFWLLAVLGVIGIWLIHWLIQWVIRNELRKIERETAELFTQLGERPDGRAD